MFIVTHVGPTRRRHRGTVSARDVSDCIRQVENKYGEHIGLAVIRLPVQPVLRLWVNEHHQVQAASHA